MLCFSLPFSIFYSIIKDSTNFFHFINDGLVERRASEREAKKCTLNECKIRFSSCGVRSPTRREWLAFENRFIDFLDSFHSLSLSPNFTFDETIHPISINARDYTHVFHLNIVDSLWSFFLRERIETIYYWCSDLLMSCEWGAEWNDLICKLKIHVFDELCTFSDVDSCSFYTRSPAPVVWKSIWGKVQWERKFSDLFFS